MNTSRRRFLQATFGSTALVSVGLTVPRFVARTAWAAARGPASGEKVLVVVQLSGGNDGLNTVVPYADDVYAAARKSLRITPQAVLAIDDYVGLHPRMGAFSELLENGRLAIVQGIGYPNPNRSHFRSMDIWHSAQPKIEQPRDGWLGRSLDTLPGAQGDIKGLHLGSEELPLALASRRSSVPSMASVAGFRLRGEGGAVPLEALRELADVDRAEAAGPLDFIRQTTLAAYSSSKRLEEATAGDEPASGYPRQYGLARKLEQVAQLIDAGLPTRVYYVSLGGFDTHSTQGAAHANLLAELADSVRAFLNDMAQRGHGERVLVMSFSEFGRRVAENASQGTDHGAAAPLFLAGPVKPGLVGQHPSLTDLDDGDPKFHTDFRRVYATVLDRWLGCPSRDVLGDTFEPLDVLAMR